MEETTGSGDCGQFLSLVFNIQVLLLYVNLTLTLCLNFHSWALTPSSLSSHSSSLMTRSSCWSPCIKYLSNVLVTWNRLRLIPVNSRSLEGATSDVHNAVCCLDLYKLLAHIHPLGHPILIIFFYFFRPA